MSTQRYLFLIKGTLVLAQPLAAPETGGAARQPVATGVCGRPLASVGWQYRAGARLL